VTALGYIRQSRRADLDVALSYDVQEAAIRRLAQRDGIDPANVRILADMGRSGAAGKEAKRPGYLEVVNAIDSGAIDTVYALSMTRLARSTVELYKLAALAAAHGVRLTFEKEGTMDPTSAMGKLQFGMMSTVAEFERDLAVERARGNVAERRARGERMGRLPYGEARGDDPAAVVAAYQEARSVNGAAKILNAGRLRTRLGRAWEGTTVRNIVARHAPELLPVRTARGVKAASPFLLFRLLRCPCGQIMTASRDRRPNRDVVYRCHRADARGDHPRPYRVQEAAVLPWIKDEIGRLRLPETVEMAGDEAERGRLGDRRDGIGDAYAAGAYGPVGSSPAKAKLTERLAEIDAAMDELDTRNRALQVPAVDWDWPPAALNTALRSLVAYVELDTSMRPVRAEWRLPAEYVS